MIVYDRPEVKNVTKQWVEDNCKYLTDRDMKIIEMLYENKRRILRRDQLEYLLPEEYQFASVDRMNKRLKLLYEKHVIDKYYPKVGLNRGSSQQYICLDRAGIILLGLDKYTKPINTDDTGAKTIVSNWQHRVLLNDYECLLIKICKDLGADILFYDSECICPYNNSTVIPDIIVVIKHNGKGYSFILEVDRSTERTSVLKNKVDNYVGYSLSREWVSQKWAKIFKNPTFPRICIVTEDNSTRRTESIREYTSSMELRISCVKGGEFEQYIFNTLMGS